MRVLRAQEISRLSSSCGMCNDLYFIQRKYKFLITALETKNRFSCKKLNEVQLDELRGIEPYFCDILKLSDFIIKTFDCIECEKQENFGKLRYARSWLRFGLSVSHDELARMFREILSGVRSENWRRSTKPKSPDIAHGDVVVARKNISCWLKSEDAMIKLQDFKYDLMGIIEFEKLKRKFKNERSEKYSDVFKPIYDSFDDFTNITHFYCRETLLAPPRICNP